MWLGDRASHAEGAAQQGRTALVCSRESSGVQCGGNVGSKREQRAHKL
jgi:hypothetical protein